MNDWNDDGKYDSQDEFIDYNLCNNSENGRSGKHSSTEVIGNIFGVILAIIILYVIVELISCF